MGVTNFAASRLIPTLVRCGLTRDEISSGSKVQEFVYLLDRVGVSLGYRYKWELCGPFSAELADEVQSLDAGTIDAAVEQVGAENEAFRRVQPLTKAPEATGLHDESWLRLVVCVDFVERRMPGATANGKTPPYVALNYDREAIDEARTQAHELLPY
jgi:hypothetical protein